MLKKSYLLEWLIGHAETAKKNDGKRAMNANYFMASLLQALLAYTADQLPRELRRDEVKAELEAVKAVLSPYVFDRKQAVERLNDAIRAENPNASKEEFLYGKIGYSSETRAKKAGKEIVDSALYLTLILEEPTDAIKKYILPAPMEAVETEEEVSIAEVARLSFLSEIDRISEHRKVQDEASLPSDDVPGVERLAGAVTLARSIQNTLLEEVFGQDQAVGAFVSGYFKASLMPSSGPQASFLFVGPAGVGKTFLAAKAAEALGLPYRRFDMSIYTDRESVVEFCGCEQGYKNGKAGNVTGFVGRNPRSVLLFDEVEKAHPQVLSLLLQILDSGKLKDHFKNKDISFAKTIVIFTTSAGQSLYDDTAIADLSAQPRQKILRALAEDLNPATGMPLFPTSVSSRFASGNIVMFNRLEASTLCTIIKREFAYHTEGFEKSTGIKLQIDDKVASAILFSEGGKADARMLKDRANAFFHEEIDELFHLLSSDKMNGSVEKLKRIRIGVLQEGACSDMFANVEKPQVLLFAEKDVAEFCAEKLKNVTCHLANDAESAKRVLQEQDVALVLCEPTVLEPDFLAYAPEAQDSFVYLLQKEDGDIDREVLLTWTQNGVRGTCSIFEKNNGFEKQVLAKCEIAYQQKKMLRLARENKALSYKIARSLSRTRQGLEIGLFDFCLVSDEKTETARHTWMRKKSEMGDEIAERIARHKAGHALMRYLDGERMFSLSLAEDEDVRVPDLQGGIYTKTELLAAIRAHMGGRAAEIVYYGEENGLSSIALGDIRAASQIARDMICYYGMDVSVAYVEPTEYGAELKERVHAVLSAEQKNAADLIALNKKLMDALVCALLERNELTEMELSDLLASATREKPVRKTSARTKKTSTAKTPAETEE